MKRYEPVTLLPYTTPCTVYTAPIKKLFPPCYDIASGGRPQDQSERRRCCHSQHPPSHWLSAARQDSHQLLTADQAFYWPLALQPFFHWLVSQMPPFHWLKSVGSAFHLIPSLKPTFDWKRPQGQDSHWLLKAVLLAKGAASLPSVRILHPAGTRKSNNKFQINPFSALLKQLFKIDFLLKFREQGNENR